MDDKLRVNIVPSDSEIARFVSKDRSLAKLAPFTRGVELLVDPSVESESLTTNLTSQREIIKALLECFELDELGI